MSRYVNDDYYLDEKENQSSLSEQFDLQHYLRILRKHKWLIFLFSALVTALAMYYVSTATPVYRAASTMLIETQKANVSIEELYGVDTGDDYYETQYEILRSRALAKRVFKRLRLDKKVAAEPASQGGLISNRGAQGKTSNDPLAAVTPPATPMAKLSRITNKITQKLGLTEEPPTPEELSSQNAELTPVSSGTETEQEQQENAELFADKKLDLAVARFRSGLNISPVRNTKLVRIAYESPDPVFAARVANVVSEEYILSVLDGRMKLEEKASAWMNSRIAVLKERLDESEQKLIEFKQENDLIDVAGGVGRLNERELLLNTTELATAKSELSNAQDLYREVRNLQRSSPELLETLPVVQNDLLVRSVKIEYGQRQRELDELSNRYGSKHPRIIDAQSRLTSLRATLDGHIARVIGSIEKDYQLRRQRVAAVQFALNQGKENTKVIGKKKIILDSLEREVATNRDIYNRLFGRLTETNSSGGLDAANARVLDEAVIPTRPIKPRKQIIVALAAIASLFFAIFMALLYEYFDETIKGTHDVERKLGIRLLGILPYLPNGILKGRKSLPLNPLDIDDKRGTFIESVNTARTALSLDEDQKNQVILITSSIPSEGKSTSALSLAYSFSQIERVLLIDCDMRQPSLAKAIGLESSTEGLSSLITRTASAKACIRRNVIGTLDVLPSGPVPQQPLELLASHRFSKILHQLKQHYDRIIIDSAPTQAVSDAFVVSRLADTVVYIVKSHETSYHLVQSGINRLNEVNAHVAGILMSQVDVDKLSAYGGDFYYQGYYDYYGYTDKSSVNNGKGKVKLTAEELRQMKLNDDQVEKDLVDYFQKNSIQRKVASTNRTTVTHDLDDPTTGTQNQSQTESASAPNAGKKVVGSHLKDDLDLI